MLMLPHDSGEAGERSETEGADCEAIGDWGIFENYAKQQKVKSEDFCFYTTKTTTTNYNNYHKLVYPFNKNK